MGRTEVEDGNDGTAARPPVHANKNVGLCRANSCLVDDSVKALTKGCASPPLTMLRNVDR
jgi:hypothetical protein